MRRKLAYSKPALTDSIVRVGSLPQGDWHVSKTGGHLFVGDTNWSYLAIMNETTNEAEFHLDKTTSMLVQAQNKTTCMDIAIESKPAYDIFVGGGAPGFLLQGYGAVLSLSRVVGVFLLVLVSNGGWPHENRESMAGPALRKPGQHLERDTGICHQSEERRPLGIHPSQGHILRPEAEVRMHDDTAQPAQLMWPHTTGAGGYAAPGEWASRHGHHQRRSKECYWHPYGCRYQDHGDWHVRRRVGRVADFAGGWRSSSQPTPRPTKRWFGGGGMRRTNLCAEPAETIDALGGDPSDWRDFKKGSSTSLQPGRYVASCDVTERGSAKARIQYWGEIHHVQLGEVYGAVIGVNVMRFDLQPDADTCHFAVCGCRATDFIVERADTYAIAAGGGLPSFFTAGTAPY